MPSYNRFEGGFGGALRSVRSAAQAVCAGLGLGLGGGLGQGVQVVGGLRCGVGRCGRVWVRVWWAG